MYVMSRVTLLGEIGGLKNALAATMSDVWLS